MKGKDVMHEKERRNYFRPGVLVLVVLAVAVTLNAGRLTAQDAEKKATAYVGTEQCLTCHDGLDKPFMSTGHRMLFSKLKDKSSKSGCEACHGPAEEHLNDPGTGVNRFGKLKPSDINAVCLKCHNKEDKKNWKVSAHNLENLSCVDCHSPHGKTKAVAGKNNKDKKKPASLLVQDQLDLCTSCHKEKAAELSKPSRHPVKQGKVSCSDCHSPHDNSAATMSRAKTGCVKCHQEKAGPYIYEHEPVSADCTSCHAPHGSINQNLLTLRQPSLCASCHTVALAAPRHDLSTTTYKTCTACHQAVHGSNSSDTFQSK